MDSIESSKQANGLQVRKKTIEEAAAIADTWLSAYGEYQPTVIDAQTWACDAVRDIAGAIRALPVNEN